MSTIYAHFYAAANKVDDVRRRLVLVPLHNRVPALPCEREGAMCPVVYDGPRDPSSHCRGMGLEVIRPARVRLDALEDALEKDVED